MKRSAAEILREYGPFPGVDHVHGVTFDGQHVWFATGDKLNALDPASGKVLRSIDVAAHAGTAFDGRHLFQIAEDRIQKIDPKTGLYRQSRERAKGALVRPPRPNSTPGDFPLVSSLAPRRHGRSRVDLACTLCDVVALTSRGQGGIDGGSDLDCRSGRALSGACDAVTGA